MPFSQQGGVNLGFSIFAIGRTNFHNLIFTAMYIRQENRKVRSDKGKKRGGKVCHVFPCRLEESLYNWAVEHKGDISLNAYMNNLVREKMNEG